MKLRFMLVDVALRGNTTKGVIQSVGCGIPNQVAAASKKRLIPQALNLAKGDPH
jgi:hypothetical protein